MKTFQIGNYRNEYGSMYCQVYVEAASVEEAAKVAGELSRRYFKPLKAPIQVDKVPSEEGDVYSQVAIIH